MIKGGSKLGSVGKVVKRESNKGYFEIVNVKDYKGNKFEKRLKKVLIIGKEKKK
jgi:ribosomal protein S4E